MRVSLRQKSKIAFRPDGGPLRIADLPAPDTKRWVIQRKAKVVAAVHVGLLSLEEACSRYTLTIDEFLAWQSSMDRHGLAGLRITRTQQYRWRQRPKSLNTAGAAFLIAAHWSPIDAVDGSSTGT
jgi:hypothetical protein